MPVDNRFGHQRYQPRVPQVPWQLVTAPRPSLPGSDEYRQAMSRVGCQYREAGVKAVYLVHGTFTGDDALGLLRGLGALFPGTAGALRRMSKNVIDTLAKDTANYTAEFAAEFERAAQVPVRLFHWSSENHHIGRAHAAVCLIDELVGHGFDPADRILLWGHSHGGNVFALMTNLLAADRNTRECFFQACRRFHGKHGGVDLTTWMRVRDWFAGERPPRRFPQLDLVTFGTPIRYGWDTNGYAKLLHVIYHRPRPGLPSYQTGLPRSLDDVLQAADGDYIQQLGIAGTNIAPNLFAIGTWLAERNLGRLLHGQLSPRELIAAWKAGVRVPEDGETLLVDYGSSEGHVFRHLAGHAVYTRLPWLAFHATEIAQTFYGAGGPASSRSSLYSGK